MRELSLLFKALSEPLRIRIIRLLLDNGKEAYGEELARALEIPAYQLSRHLKVLKTTGLIHERRQGRWVYYSLADRNGHLLRTLRRLIAKASFPPTNGNGQQQAKTAKRQRRGVARNRPFDSPRRMARLAQGRPERAKRSEGRQARIEQDDFNWNQGPAIPGVL